MEAKDLKDTIDKVGLATLIASACYTIHLRRSKNASCEDKSEKAEDPSMILRPLNHQERQFQAIALYPVASVTWFQGDAAAMEEAAAIIRPRIARLVVANPWLAGGLVRLNDHRRVGFQYPKKLGDVDEIVNSLFHVVRDGSSNTHHEMTIAEVRSATQESGYCLRALKDFEQPLWRITLAPSSTDPSKYGLFASMCHFVGDGDTFYTLYNMVVAGSDIVALDERRVEDIQAIKSKYFTKRELEFTRMPGLLLSLFFGTLRTQLIGPLFGLTKYSRSVRCFLVDPQKIEELKKEELRKHHEEEPDSEIKFLSTNDILATWFIRQSGFRHGWMTVNLRGRIPEFKTNLAGNYIHSLYFRSPEDLESPVSLRKTLPRLKRIKTHETDVTQFEHIKGGMAFLTNWATFASKEVKLGKHSKQLLHLPCYDVINRGGDSMAACIVFQATPTHIGLMIAGTADAQEKFFDPPFASDEPFPLLGSGIHEGKRKGMWQCLMGFSSLDPTFFLGRKK